MPPFDAATLRRHVTLLSISLILRAADAITFFFFLSCFTVATLRHSDTLDVFATAID